MKKRYELSDLFSFSKSDLDSHLLNSKRMRNKFYDSVQYVSENLGVQDFKSFDDLSWCEGKNYRWTCFKKDGIVIILRRFHSHFTVYFSNTHLTSWEGNVSGCFVFNSTINGLTGEQADYLLDNPYCDLEISLDDILKIIKKDKTHMLWHDTYLKRPINVEIKNIYNGCDNIHNIDLFVFACEELFQIYLDLFSEKTIVEKLKTLEVGQILNSQYKILRVDLNEDDKGLKVLDVINGKEFYTNIYGITQFHLKDLFPEL